MNNNRKIKKDVGLPCNIEFPIWLWILGKFVTNEEKKIILTVIWRLILKISWTVLTRIETVSNKQKVTPDIFWDTMRKSIYRSKSTLVYQIQVPTAHDTAHIIFQKDFFLSGNHKIAVYIINWKLPVLMTVPNNICIYIKRMYRREYKKGALITCLTSFRDTSSTNWRTGRKRSDIAENSKRRETVKNHDRPRNNFSSNPC